MAALWSLSGCSVSVYMENTFKNMLAMRSKWQHGPSANNLKSVVRNNSAAYKLSSSLPLLYGLLILL